MKCVPNITFTGHSRNHLPLSVFVTGFALISGVASGEAGGSRPMEPPVSYAPVAMDCWVLICPCHRQLSPYVQPHGIVAVPPVLLAQSCYVVVN